MAPPLTAPALSLLAACFGAGVRSAQIDSPPPTPKPPTNGSKPEWDRAVEKVARDFLASKTFKTQHPGDDLKSFEVTGTSLVRHPRIAEFLPRHRFYFAHVRQRTEQEFKGKILESFYLTEFLCRVDTRTGRARFTDRMQAVDNQQWRFDVIQFLRDQALRVTDRGILSLGGSRKCLVLLFDSNSDLWAATYNGTSWVVTNGGAALETNLSSISSRPFSLELR